MAETPHQVWKAFCRLAEEKPFVQQFGSSILAQIETFAVFEFSAEQSQVAQKIEILPKDEHPLPPFPFPKIAMVHHDGLMLLQQPEMNEADSILGCEMMLFVYGSNGKHALAQAKIEVNIPASLEKQQFVYEAIDTKSQVYLQEGVMNYPRASKSDEAELIARAAVALRNIESAAQKDPAKAELFAKDKATIEKHLSSIQQMELDLEKVHLTMAKTNHEALEANFISVLQSVAWINRPNHYIIEKSPETVFKGKRKPGHLRRLGERHRYIILDHSDIRQRWTEAQGTHASPMPHLRRGHFKTLKSERYKEARGKVIWVSPCHVNGACVEWRDGNISYKVVG